MLKNKKNNLGGKGRDQNMEVTEKNEDYKINYNIN